MTSEDIYKQFLIIRNTQSENAVNAIRCCLCVFTSSRFENFESKLDFSIQSYVMSFRISAGQYSRGLSSCFCIQLNQHYLVEDFAFWQYV